MSFESPLRVELCGREWRLLEPLVWRDPLNNMVIAPAGVMTDFASVPRLMRPFALNDSKTAKAATAHDWMYRSTCGRRLNRRWADDVFLQMLRSNGVHWLPAWCYWAGVRLFGWMAYKQKREHG